MSSRTSGNAFVPDEIRSELDRFVSKPLDAYSDYGDSAFISPSSLPTPSANTAYRRSGSREDVHTNTTTSYARDGVTIIARTTETVSADGRTRTELIDVDGNTTTDTHVNQTITFAGAVKTTAINTLNGDGSLRSTHQRKAERGKHTSHPLTHRHRRPKFIAAQASSIDSSSCPQQPAVRARRSNGAGLNVY